MNGRRLTALTASRWSAGVRLGVVVAAAAVALAACGSSASTSSTPSSSSSGSGSAADTAPIKIGTVGGYSGFSADTSLATAQGLQAWAKDINSRGGLDGHQVEVIVKDDASDPAKSELAVKTLVESDHVIALVGNHEAGQEGVWASYIDSKHVPVVGGVAGGDPYVTDPNFFPVTDTSANASVGYPNAAKLFGKSKVSVVYCAEVPACAQQDGQIASYAKMLGIGHVPGVSVSGTATSYTAQCEKLKGEGADAVFLGTALVTAQRFVQECATQGYKPLFIDEPLNWKSTDASDPTWNGLVLAADAPLWFGDGPGTAEFLAAMKKYEPTADLNNGTTTGWYAGKAFEAALKGATGPITSQSVYDGLYKLGPNFDLGGVISPVTYTKGAPAKEQLCSWYAQVKDGKETAPEGTKPVCPKTTS
jgi:branched-chain amino acid transport system substrate-binding protein